MRETGYIAGMPRVIGEAELAESFNQRLGQSAEQRLSLAECLTRCQTVEELEAAEEAACAAHGSRLITLAAGFALTAREWELYGRERPDPLKVHVALVVHGVTIPDVGRDELRLDLEIFTGAKAGDVVDFLIGHRLMTAEEGRHALERWQEADCLIGREPLERDALDYCLGVAFRDQTEERIWQTNYTLGPQTGLLWQESMRQVIIQTPLNTNDYPFDETVIPLQIINRSQSDPTEKQLCQDTHADDPFALSGRVILPRGFELSWRTKELVEVVGKQTADTLPDSLLLAGLALRRRAESVVWRTFLPALFILGLGLAAAVLALLTRQFVDSTLTQVLPAVLISCVALQITAVSGIPANSRQTWIDRVFILIYAHVFVLFLGLGLMSVPLLGLAALVLLSGVLLVVRRLRRHHRPLEL